MVHPDGKLDIYRKIHLAPPERKCYLSGGEAPLFRAAGLTFGIQLCYDAHFPELAACMADRGADAIFLPHASPRGTAKDKHASWMRHLPARAFDNSLYVVACNQSGKNQSGLNFPGVSVIIDPAGRIIKKNTGGKEGFLMIRRPPRSTPR